MDFRAERLEGSVNKFHVLRQARRWNWNILVLFEQVALYELFTCRLSWSQQINQLFSELPMFRLKVAGPLFSKLGIENSHRFDSIVRVSESQIPEVFSKCLRSVDGVFKFGRCTRNFSYGINHTMAFEESRFRCRRRRVFEILKGIQVHIGQVKGRLNTDDACEKY